MIPSIVAARGFLRNFLLISFLLISQSSAYLLKFKWSGLDATKSPVIVGDTETGAACQRINKPLASPSDSQIEAVSALNRYGDQAIHAMGLWLDPNCEGDPDVFIGWIVQDGFNIWQLVDLNRIGGSSTAVAKYAAWKPITPGELESQEGYASFRHPTNLGDGGYVILDGETDEVIRTAQFVGGGEGPIVQFGVVNAASSQMPVHDILNATGDPSGDSPIRRLTDLPATYTTEYIASITPANLASGQLRFRIKDKSMPALRAAGDTYDWESSSNLINDITQDILQEVPRPNTQYLKDYEAPLPKDVADNFRKSLENASARKQIKLEAGQGPIVPQVRGSLSTEEALRRVGIPPGANTGEEVRTIDDYLLEPSFWPKLYNTPGKNPYQAMGISPEDLQADYWKELQMSANNGNPVDILAPHQLSNLIKNRMFGPGPDGRPNNIPPTEFENDPPNPFPAFIQRHTLGRYQLEDQPKVWANDPTQHPTYRPPRTNIEVEEPEAEVKVEETVVQQNPAPVLPADNVPSDPSDLEGDFHAPVDDYYYRSRFRRR
ncbi:hypothetical protein TWF481_009601 [Arthrobotrys musiformis]|uniref:Uncharacterized protein n=1 Tax=Arthrobotrys musiformis TaxID=47236 RepID=A0AAV9W684_9PEZI